MLPPSLARRCVYSTRLGSQLHGDSREIIHVMESGQSFDFAADTGSEVLPLLATQDVMVPLVDPESFQPATELPLFAHHSGQTR